MPQPQPRLDPQALQRLLTEWVTVSGRRLGAAGRETLEWLVREAGLRRTTVRLSGNPFGVDPRSMRERLQRLAEDGAIRIYGVRPGCRGGVELRVRDLFAIHAYRLAELDRDKWLLELDADCDERPTLSLESARVSAPRPSHSDQVDASNARLTAPKPSQSVDDCSGNAGVSAPKPSHSYSGEVDPVLIAVLTSSLLPDELQVWLKDCRFEIGTTTKIFSATDFEAQNARRLVGRKVQTALLDAGLPPAEFLVDEGLKNARVGAPKPSHSPINELINSTKPFKGFVELEFNQANPPPLRGDFGDHPLLLAAEGFFNAVGVHWRFRWFAIQGITLLREGAIKRETIEAQLADPELRKQILPRGLQKLAGREWRKLPEFKAHLATKYGIEWEDRFANGRVEAPWKDRAATDHRPKPR